MKRSLPASCLGLRANVTEPETRPNRREPADERQPKPGPNFRSETPPAFPGFDYFPFLPCASGPLGFLWTAGVLCRRRRGATASAALRGRPPLIADRFRIRVVGDQNLWRGRPTAPPPLPFRIVQNPNRGRPMLPCIRFLLPWSCGDACPFKSRFLGDAAQCGRRGPASRFLSVVSPFRGRSWSRQNFAVPRRAIGEVSAAFCGAATFPELVRFVRWA